jgi:release factor glutamine methyltransferase
MVLLTDISGDAVETARENAILNRVGQSVCYAVGDRLEFMREDPVNGFDIVVCNPPYVESGMILNLQPEVRDHDPRVALDGGPDGLRFIDGLLSGVPSILSEGGLVAFEIGAGQGKQVKALFKRVGLEGVEVVKDLAGLDRVVAARGF